MDDLQVSEAINLLYSDIKFLVKIMFLEGRMVPEAEVRAASGILRRWVVENRLSDIIRETKKEILFPVLDNIDVIKEIEINKNINFFMTGGVKFQGRPVMGIYQSRSDFEGSTELPVNTMKSKLISLRDFVRQKRIYYEGSFFSCEEIIRFVTNKAGGVHLDYDRSSDLYTRLEAAFRWATFGSEPTEAAFRPIGALHFGFEPGYEETLTAFHVEVIAAAASFVQMQVDGIPLVPLVVRKSIMTRLQLMSGLRRRIRFVLSTKVSN